MRLTERGKNVLAYTLALPPVVLLCAVLFYGVFLN